MLQIDLNSSTSIRLRREDTYDVTESSGSRWAVKRIREESRRASLFVEYVVGSLAAEYGLSWPEVELAELTEGQVTELAVALPWLDGLTCIFPDEVEFMTVIPAEESTMDAAQKIKDRPEIVRKTLEPLLANEENLRQLCGFEVFWRWTYPQDTKNDILHMDPSGSLWFLDGEHHLGNTVRFGWLDIPSPLERVRGWRYEFAKGLRQRLADISHFDTWLSRLLDPALIKRFETAVSEVPAEWLPPMERIQHIRERLFIEAPSFVEEFRAHYETHYSKPKP